MKKVYIVTGANGFLGNNIIRNIKLDADDEIRALVRSRSNVDSLNGLNCSIYIGDVTDVNSLDGIFDVSNAKIICIHCAAVVYIKDKYDKNVFDVNVNGTMNVAKKCMETNARLVYISTVHAIKEPKDNGVIVETDKFNPDLVDGFYAKSKAEALRRLLNMSKKQNLDLVVLHPSGIIGPNDYGNTHAVINAICKGKKGECYIVSNRYASIKEICDIVCEYLNLKKVKIVPFSLALFGAPFCEFYYNLMGKTPLFTKYSLNTLKTNSNFSNLKAKNELDFHPRELKITVKDTVDWLKSVNKL